MNIPNIGEKINPKNKLFTIIVIILLAFASYGLGRLSKIEENKPPIKIINSATAVQAISTNSNGIGENTPPISGNYVASKSGSKYHLPWCSGASRIKEENKIWFETKEDAEKAGYAPASNCKGI